MHALKTMHTALRPRGLLLDVRPAPRHPWLEVQRGDTGERGIRLGQIDDSFRIGTLATADAALQTLIDAGWFVRESGETFTFVYQCDSVNTWLAHMAEHWSTARINAELIARAHSELAKGPGALRVLRAIYAARLRRT